MHPEFFLDFAILSDTSDKANASQNAGRIKGNIKKWTNYKKPIVYTTENFDKIATEYEEMSRNIAKLAWDKNHDHPTIITKSDIKNEIKDRDWLLFTKEFLTLEAANNFLKTHGAKQKKTFKKENEFILSSTTKRLSVTRSP